ncbi:FAD-binding domain-containing protein [Delitschia confertaspora ATCC 74209]|uniref:FAD-binding domain-containing protein n=1 Tax=Delitschia confertaspora ATCC 74209 TaxID=1513339 RepID=A0A9P4JG53_9PLEO|nr:FAD-binding domain-containing protein [Delitschia confertaspora ATCC 74209]
MAPIKSCFHYLSALTLLLAFIPRISTAIILSRDLKATIHNALEHEYTMRTPGYGLQVKIAESSALIDSIAAVDDATPVSKRATAACRVAEIIFPGRVFAANSSEYQAEQEYNWSQTCWLPAACFIRPQSAVDVAAALKIIRHTGTKFAVRTGGHNPNSGFGSIDGSGVLLDLRDLDFLSLDDDATLQAGPGNTWGKVYDFLDPHGRSAIGGRHYTVGLPGFLLGGGMTFFPNLYGLGIDSVKNFEVVLSDSRIVNANADENPDLFQALKGGGPNFGIVTRFDIETHPLHNVQYSLNLYDPSDYKAILEATTQVQHAMESDSKIGLFLNVNPTVIIAGLLYADWPAEPPKAFTPFANLKSFWGHFIPPMNGTIASLTSSINIGDYPAKREPYAVSTEVDHGLYVQVHEKYLGLLKTANMPSANLSYTIQPVSRGAVEASKERGSSSLGLKPVSQTWWAPLVEWFDDSDDEAAHKALNSLGTGVQCLAEDGGKLIEYQFMNDASYTQTVLESYGEENLKRLKAVQQKFDPESFFQKFQGDGFLLRKL